MGCLLSAGRWPLTHPWLVPAAPFRSTLPSLPRMGELIAATNCSPCRLELCQQRPRSHDVVGKSAWRHLSPLGIMHVGKPAQAALL